MRGTKGRKRGTKKTVSLTGPKFFASSAVVSLTRWHVGSRNRVCSNTATLRPRHALIGDGLRRPSTAAYTRTRVGKCGGRGSCQSADFWHDAASPRSYRQQLFAAMCCVTLLPAAARGENKRERRSATLSVVVSYVRLITRVEGSELFDRLIVESTAMPIIQLNSTRRLE